MDGQIKSADVACVCLTSTSIPTQQTLGGEPSVEHVALTIIRSYNGPPAGTQISGRYAAGAFGLAPGSRYLILLGSELARSKEYAIENVLTIPQKFPRDTSVGLPQTLEGDLIQEASLQLDDEIEAVSLLDQFAFLSDSSLGKLKQFTISKKSSVALLSYILLIKKSSAPNSYFSRFIVLLSATPIAEWPDMGDVTMLFAQNATVSDEAALEVLVGSQRRDISYAALRAIRKLSDPATIGFLIKKLDAQDSTIQYLALISLAEINHKYGEYAPGMGVFDQDRARYIRLWKDWYSSIGKPT